jgi:hypothetical protein
MIDQDINARVAAYKGNPQALQQKYAASQQLIDLLALQKIKSAQEAAAREMQMQMAQQQAANGESNMTVAQQREKEVMDMTKNELAQQRGELAQQQQQEQKQAMQQLMGGIASAPGAASAMEPQAMAAGGIVAFDNGGPTGKDGSADKEDTEQERKERVAKLLQRIIQENGGKLPASLKAGYAGLDVLTLPGRGLMGAANTGIVRPLRAMGANVPYIPERMFMGDSSSMTPAYDELRRAEASYAANQERDRNMQRARAEGANLRPTMANDPRIVGATPPAETVAGPAPTPTAPPQVAPRPPMPAAPRPQAQQGLGGLQMGPPEDTLQNALRRQSIAAMNTDPKAEKLAEEKRVEDRLKLTPTQRGIYEEGIAGLRGMYEQDFDPEMQRREGIKRYLLGMGGRSMGEFAGGAGAAMDYDTRQKAQKLARFKDLQEKREGLVSLERDPVVKGIDAGFKTYEQAGNTQRTGLTAGANVYGTETQSKDNAAMREIERLKIGAQNAATAAQRDANDFAKLSGHLSTITYNRAKAEQAVVKGFQKDAQAIEMALMANPKDKEALANKAALQLRIEAEVDKTTKPFDLLASTIQAKLYGGGQGGLGGFTVREKPTK